MAPQLHLESSYGEVAQVAVVDHRLGGRQGPDSCCLGVISALGLTYIIVQGYMLISLRGVT